LIRVAPPRVIAPDTVFSPPALYSAPLLSGPLPVSVSASAVPAPLSFSWAPLATVVPAAVVPSADACATDTTPALICTGPA